MNEDARISETLRQIAVISGQIGAIQNTIQELRLQQGLFSSHFESEKGNLTRLMNDLNRDLEKLNDTIFNRDNGLLLLADRVEQREKKREMERRERIAMWLMIGSIVLKEIWEMLSKTK